MIDLLLAVGAICAAIITLRSRRLLTAAIWLAIVSAIISINFFRLGAAEVAVIELSVGAGLVTVLFVFAIAVSGEEALDAPAVIPAALSWSLAVLATLLLLWMALPGQPVLLEGGQTAVVEAPFSQVLWQERGLDVLIQVSLIFAGVLGILGLLAEDPVKATATRTPPAGTEPAPAAPVTGPAPALHQGEGT